MKKLLDLLKTSNKNGIYLPLLHDPKTDKASYTLTMFFIAFNVALITLIGKVAKVLDGVDYSNVLWLLGLTGSFYLGRRIQGDKNGFSVDGSIGNTNQNVVVNNDNITIEKNE